MTNETKYLFKLKSAGWTDAKIARKLGWTEAQVQQHLLSAVADFQQEMENGYASLKELFTTLCCQYQLVGESLKVLAGAIGDALSAEEIEALWEADPKKMAAKLRTHCIPLRPFAPPDPEPPRSAEEGNSQKN